MGISKRFNLFIVTSLITAASLLVLAQQNVSPQEKTAVSKAITDYVQKDQQLKGSFLIKDEKVGAVRELKFDHVHAGVDPTADGRYVACVDFKEGNKVLDLDFYLKPASAGKFEISDIRIHKIDGKDVSGK